MQKQRLFRLIEQHIMTLYTRQLRSTSHSLPRPPASIAWQASPLVRAVVANVREPLRRAAGVAAEAAMTREFVLETGRRPHCHNACRRGGGTTGCEAARLPGRGQRSRGGTCTTGGWALSSCHCAQSKQCDVARPQCLDLKHSCLALRNHGGNPSISRTFPEAQATSGLCIR